MFYKVTLGLTTGATYNMTNVHVFKAAQARRAYFFCFVDTVEYSKENGATTKNASAVGSDTEENNVTSSCSK